MPKPGRKPDFKQSPRSSGKPTGKPSGKGGGSGRGSGRGTVARALTQEHLEFLQACREAFVEMCAAAEVSEEELRDGDATEVCDQVIRWWHAQRKSQRPDFDAAANIIGVTMGDLLIGAFPKLEWRYITDQHGTSLGLWHADPEVVVAPLDLSLDRLNEEVDGFVGSLLPALADEVEKTLSGK